jgi:hypothetical protein
MGKILVIGLIVMFFILILLETGGHIEQPFLPPFQEGDLIQLRGETAIGLKYAPQGYNEGQIEKVLTTLLPEEVGTIRQGGDIQKPCFYSELRWWCRITLTNHRFGWTEVWQLKKVNG